MLVTWSISHVVYQSCGLSVTWSISHVIYQSCKAHQTRRSGRNSRPISAEVTLPRLQSEIKVTLFLFASHSFLANSLRFMVKLIDKAIVINGKIHKNKRKRFYSSNKEGLICWYKCITANFCKFVLTKFQVKITSQILKYTNRHFLYQIGRWIVLYSNYFHKTWVICSFLKAKQSTCLSFKHDDQTFRCHWQISRQIWIKSKINKYKINNNNKTNTGTKHEFNVKYEGYKQDISKDALQMPQTIKNVKKTHIFAKTCLYDTVGSLPVMPSLLPYGLWGRSQVSLFLASVVSPGHVIYQSCGLSVMWSISNVVC